MLLEHSNYQSYYQLSPNWPIITPHYEEHGQLTKSKEAKEAATYENPKALFDVLRELELKTKLRRTSKLDVPTQGTLSTDFL
ncbi:hypothetical protein JTE90_021295 [Oedothorax gibbosus]|uniref:Uncharacterized protein n=1 Tax=Oedothorax gibbosus TaxID=931172 RepID=A0AAV6VLP6_9ARAC|nr:hypothetical protein JTE90_021295 [Oedothorax gibbosus]